MKRYRIDGLLGLGIDRDRTGWNITIGPWIWTWGRKQHV